MSGTWLIGAALALFVLVGGGLLRTEATTRLERFPLLILRLAARRLPHVLRAEQLEEWRANVLDVIEPSSVGLPLTRFARGCSFALSSWWGARRLARTQIPTTPRNAFVALRVSTWVYAALRGRAAARRGWPRLLCHMIIYAIASWWVTAPFILLSYWSEPTLDFPLRVALVLARLGVLVLFQGVPRGMLSWMVEQAPKRGWSDLTQFRCWEASRTFAYVGFSIGSLVFYPTLINLGALGVALLITVASQSYSWRRYRRAGFVPAVPQPLLTQVQPI